MGKKSKISIPDELTINDLLENGDVAKATKAKRQSSWNRLAEFTQAYKGVSLEDVVKAAMNSVEGRVELESILMAFLASLKSADEVDENGDPLPPMKNTIEGTTYILLKYLGPALIFKSRTSLIKEVCWRIFTGKLI